MLAVDGLALSVRAPPGLIGFAPYGRLTFFACAKKVSKETHPCIRPRLRRGSLAPPPLQGHAAKGHPWPIAALATSMSLNPFRGDSTRPPEGDLGVVCEIALQEQKPNCEGVRGMAQGGSGRKMPGKAGRARMARGVAGGCVPKRREAKTGRFLGQLPVFANALALAR